MELDWSALQKEAATGGLLPDGDYNLVVTEATSVTASTGKPMIKMKLRVMSGPQQDKPVYTQQVLSPDNPMALRIFFQTMAAFGLDANFFASLPSGTGGMEIVASNLRNRAATATLTARTWQGQDRNEVSAWRPLQTDGPVPPGVVTGPAAPVATAGTPATPPAGPPVPTGQPPAPTTPATAPSSVPPPPQPF